MHPQSSAPTGPVRLAHAGRVSTVDQEREGTSLQDQAAKWRLYANLHNMACVPSEAYCGDESGALPLAAPAGSVPVPVSYPPLVTREEWEAAQEVNEQRKLCPVRASAEEYLFYGGMARCIEHDRAFVGSADRNGFRWYRCKRRLHPGGSKTHGMKSALLACIIHEVATRRSAALWSRCLSPT